MPTRVLVLVTLLAWATGCAVRPPEPISFDGGTIALRGLSATRQVAFPDMHQASHLNLGFEVDQAAPPPGTLQTQPKVKLGYLHDEHDRPLPLHEADHAGWGDMRSILELTYAAPGADPKPLAFGMGAAQLERLPRRLGRVGGVVEFLRVPGTRSADIAVERLSDPVEVEKGLTMSMRQQPLRTDEVRATITYVVVTDRATIHEPGGRLPPVPLHVELLDQSGKSLGPANPTGGSTGSTRMEAERVAVVRLEPGQTIDRVRIRLADTFELVSVPFEFRDVPVAAP